jgi:hypothetical protein
VEATIHELVYHVISRSLYFERLFAFVFINVLFTENIQLFVWIDADEHCSNGSLQQWLGRCGFEKYSGVANLKRKMIREYILHQLSFPKHNNTQ